MQNPIPSNGLLAYVLNVDTLESLTIADKKLDIGDPEYAELIDSAQKKLLELDENTYRKNPVLLEAKIARLRFSFLCKKIFSTRAIRMEGLF